MKYSEGKLGRTFIIKMEDGDKLPDTIENFAKKNNIESACLFYIGGADNGSKIVVGPEGGTEKKPIPMIHQLNGVHEATGIGTLFLNEKGEHKLHMHSAFGRGNKTITGCVRKGVDIWLIGEIILIEIINTGAKRKLDRKSNFELLEP